MLGGVDALQGRPPEDTAFIALGSNLADPAAQLRRAARALETLGAVTARSSLYQTAPVGGPPGQAPYLNAVVSLTPRNPYQNPETLLGALLALEKSQGRVRLARWGPRTLDLDLLSYGTRVLDTVALTLPHPRMWERVFVLEPLCEVAPEFRHPVTGESPCAALVRLGRSGVRKTEHSW